MTDHDQWGYACEDFSRSFARRLVGMVDHLYGGSGYNDAPLWAAMARGPKDWLELGMELGYSACAEIMYEQLERAERRQGNFDEAAAYQNLRYSTLLHRKWIAQQTGIYREHLKAMGAGR